LPAVSKGYDFDECHDNHGKGRWAVKNDPSTPPTDANAIQSVTPSQMFSWPGINAQLTWQSERTGLKTTGTRLQAALLL
jgi:hypothetical protein